jgi:hypothetical protein
MLLWVIVTRRWRALLWFVVTAGLVALVTLIVIGPREHMRYVVEILPGLLSEQPSSSSENMAPSRFLLRGFELSPGIAKRIGQAFVGLLLLVSVAVVARRRDVLAGGTGAVAAFSVFVPLMLLAMPNSWVNYQLLLLLPFAVLAYLARSAGRGEGLLLWLLLVVAYVPMLFYWPCAPPTVHWPCAQTPLFLGVARLSRPFHDAMVDARLLSPLLLWVGLISWLWVPARS